MPTFYSSILRGFALPRLEFELHSSTPLLHAGALLTALEIYDVMFSFLYCCSPTSSPRSEERVYASWAHEWSINCFDEHPERSQSSSSRLPINRRTASRTAFFVTQDGPEQKLSRSRSASASIRKRARPRQVLILNSSSQSKLQTLRVLIMDDSSAY